MKASMPQRAQRKRRTESRIVDQATTDEPSTEREVPCYPNDTLVLATSGGGTVSVRLATFKPMLCRFFSGRSWALCTVSIGQPSSPFGLDRLLRIMP
jgi:hypothetical protein